MRRVLEVLRFVAGDPEPDMMSLAGALLVVGIMVIMAVPMYVYFKRKDWL